MPKIIHHDSTFIIVEQSNRLATLFEVFYNNDNGPYLQKRFNYDPSQFDYLTKGSNNFVFINKDKKTVFKVPTYEGMTVNKTKTNSATIVEKWNQIHKNKSAYVINNNDFFITSTNQEELEKSHILETNQPFRGLVKSSLFPDQEINQNEIAGSVASFPYLEEPDYSKLFMEHFNLSQEQYKALKSRLLISYEEISKVDKENDQKLSPSKTLLNENFKEYDLENIKAFELSVNRAIKAECLRIYTETGLIIYDAHFNNFLFSREKANDELKAICIDVDYALNHTERLKEKKENNENILLKVDFGRDATGIANILKYIDDQINSNSFFDGGLKFDHLSHDVIKSLIVGDKTIEQKVLEADRSMLDPKDVGKLFERLEEKNPILKMQAMLKSYLTKRTEQKRWGLSKKWSMQEKKINVLRHLYNTLGNVKGNDWNNIKEKVKICKSLDQKLNWRNKKSENQKMLQDCLDIVDSEIKNNNNTLKK